MIDHGGSIFGPGQAVEFGPILDGWLFYEASCLLPRNGGSNPRGPRVQRWTHLGSSRDIGAIMPQDPWQLITEIPRKAAFFCRRFLKTGILVLIFFILWHLILSETI